MNHHDYSFIHYTRKKKKSAEDSSFFVADNIYFWFNHLKDTLVFQISMAAPNKDEILSNFIAITQCPNDEAVRYLEASQWNAETAMEIFFDNGGSQSGEPIHSTNPVPSGTNVNQGSSGLYELFFCNNMNYFSL